MPLIVCLVSSLIMPAMASEPPEEISTVVSARRVLVPGTPCTATDGSISETSDITTGVKFRATPNGLNWGVWDGPAAPGSDTVAGGGIGNSPPTRKDADA